MVTYIPKAPLSAFVTCFWARKLTCAPERELALPTGTVELVINLREEPLRVLGQDAKKGGEGFREGLVCGPHTEPFVIDSSPDEEVIGVNFRPGGVFPFVDVPGGELLNARVPLDALWSFRGAKLRDELADTADLRERFQRLERFLLRHARRPLAFDRRVAYTLEALQSGLAGPNVSALAAETGLSRRRHIELFRTVTGLTPKQYARVRRLQRVLEAIDRNRPHSWAEVAYECGYYDQSHLYRDFQAMTSMLPGEYAKLRGERMHHVPAPREHEEKRAFPKR